ncbi:MAG: sialidase family protein [Verrucomicrobiia bacterium]
MKAKIIKVTGLICLLLLPFFTNGATRLDLNDKTALQTIVDREPGQYLGHPTTCLLEDGKTILCVYPKGHGRGAIVYKKSVDGGLTWSDRLPTPKSWETSKETPTIHRIITPDGKKRLILWLGLYPARFSISDDDGGTWTELKPAGDWGGIVVMSSLIELRTKPVSYMALFHDDGRYFSNTSKQQKPVVFTLYKTFSSDGGLTWTLPQEIYKSSQVHLCEPGAVRSPDGKEIAILLRENSRQKNSHIMFTTDEGKSFSEPKEVQSLLNGDRHTAKYSSDGRLLVSFRKVSPAGKKDEFEGDWIAWVGKYDDLKNNSEGEYLIRLKDNLKGMDCAYPGVEVLPDGTFVLVTYGHWETNQQPYILCIRFKLDQIDKWAKDKYRRVVNN